MADFLSYENVGFSSTHVWEAHRGRVVERWSHSDLSSCVLRRGSPEQRPSISAVIGIILLLPAAVFCYHMYLLITEGSFSNPRYELAMLTFGLVGVWLLAQSFIVKRYFIEVTLKAKKRKLIFGRKASLIEVKLFLGQVEAKYEIKPDDQVAAA